jgi:hypothetical protein
MEYESYDVSVLCSACLCELHTDEERQQHYTSEWHIYNIKRKTAELPPIPFELFHEKFTMVQKMQAEDKARNGKITCPITKRQFKSQSAYDHFRTTKEYARQYERFVIKRQKEQEQAQSGIVVEQVVKSKHFFEWIAPSSEDDQPTANDLALIEQDKLDEEELKKIEAEEGETSTTATTTTTTTSTTAPTNMAEDDDEELQEGQVAIPLKHSLFDNIGPFTCTRTAYTYMSKKYNFKLPHIDFLIDLEGLMEYLGAKVGIGHVCIGCNKRFETTRGCMQHMVDQNHTTFSLETLQLGGQIDDSEDGKNGGDFVFDFYDFSHNFAESTYTTEEIQSRQMSRLRTLLVLGIKTLTEIHLEEARGNDVLSKVLTVPIEGDIQLAGLTETGDIKLTDGSTVVSRKNKDDLIMSRTVQFYEKRNQQIMEYKLANKSVMTKEKEQDLHELKHVQKYWRRQLQKIGLRQNYIMKEYFRKQNMQNN